MRWFESSVANFTIRKLVDLMFHQIVILLVTLLLIFFSIWVFFHNHSRTTGLQGKEEGISLTLHYHFHPLHRHLDISQAITAESLPLHIGSSRIWTGNLWLPSTSYDDFVILVNFTIFEFNISSLRHFPTDSNVELNVFSCSLKFFFPFLCHKAL